MSGKAGPVRACDRTRTGPVLPVLSETCSWVSGQTSFTKEPQLQTHLRFYFLTQDGPVSLRAFKNTTQRPQTRPVPPVFHNVQVSASGLSGPRAHSTPKRPLSHAVPSLQSARIATSLPSWHSSHVPRYTVLTLRALVTFFPTEISETICWLFLAQADSRPR